MNRPGADPAAPPPPPPPTPAEVLTPQLPRRRGDSFDGGGIVGGAADTEAFPIDESEGEEPSAYPARGGIDGRGDAGGEEKRGELASSPSSASSLAVTTARPRLEYIDPARDESGREGEERRGGREEGGRGGVSETIRIEDFLAMPETGSDVGGGSGRGGGSGGGSGGDGDSK